MDNNLSLKLFITLFKSHSSIHKLVEKDIKSHNMNMSEFAVLELLYSKGDQSMQDICQRTLLANSSMTYVIDKLEKKQLIKRCPSTEDRRITTISLTEQGSNIIKDILPKHLSFLESIFEDISEEDKEQVIKLLKVIGLKAKNKMA